MSSPTVQPPAYAQVSDEHPVRAQGFHPGAPQGWNIRSLYTSVNSISLISSSSPASHSKSVAVQEQRPNGRSRISSVPHWRQRARPLVSMISSSAPSTGVPCLQRSKQKRTASGRTAVSLPISTTTRRTFLPRARSETMVTISCVIPSSCMQSARCFCFCLIKQFSYQRPNQLDGWLDGCCYRFAEAKNSVLARLQRGRLAPDETKRRQLPSQVPRKPKCLVGDHAVRVHPIIGRAVVGIRLQHVQRAGNASPSCGINQYGKVVAVKQRVRQVKAADAEIDHRYLIRQRSQD